MIIMINKRAHPSSLLGAIGFGWLVSGGFILHFAHDAILSYHRGSYARAFTLSWKDWHGPADRGRGQPRDIHTFLPWATSWDWSALCRGQSSTSRRQTPAVPGSSSVSGGSSPSSGRWIERWCGAAPRWSSWHCLSCRCCLWPPESPYKVALFWPNRRG